MFAAPRQMRTWTLEGYSSDEVLGASNGKNGFGIFVADVMEPRNRERIYADLSGDESRRTHLGRSGKWRQLAAD